MSSFLTAFTAAIAAFAPATLTEEKARADLEAAAQLIRTEHAAPFAHLPEEDWQAIVDRQLAALSGEVTVLDLHRNLTRMAGALACAHSFVNLPEDFDAPFKKDAQGFPEPVRIIGGRLFFAGGKLAGQEVLSINGTPAPLVLDAVRNGVVIDGFGEDRKEGETARRFAYFYATQIDPSPEEFIVSVEGQRRPRRLEPTEGLSSPQGDPDDPFLEVSASDGALEVRIGGFYDRDSDGQFTDLLDTVRASLANDPAQPVIVDLRGNPGGIDAFGVATIGLFADEPFTVYDEVTANPGFDREGYTLEERADGTLTVIGLDGTEETAPASTEHTGPLIIIVDSRTGSTAADVASHLDAFEDAIIVGEETTGAYNANSSGYLDLHVLPNSGARLYLPRFRYITSAADDRFIHRGIIPDVPVKTLPEDLRSGRDRAHEVARDIAAGSQR
ncbi:hypothetical protein HK107_15380 [Parvularcula sp. ZS-1/3]|uniref:Tail specific protease domain-containing protein n=1 Tax=Parvularcula mediterranea TaxID=2732508 RepID=A0A7Y3RP76_9PROT|nr:S41 family peptidase [Parvularcula mediterranea]NNU17713.1 hypothetical protein [Parvularcula mediterranea]